MKAFGVAKLPATGGTPTTIVPGNSMWQMTVSGDCSTTTTPACRRSGACRSAEARPRFWFVTSTPVRCWWRADTCTSFTPAPTLQANVLRVPGNSRGAPSVSPMSFSYRPAPRSLLRAITTRADGVSANQTTLYYDNDNRVMMVPLTGRHPNHDLPGLTFGQLRPHRDRAYRQRPPCKREGVLGCRRRTLLRHHGGRPWTDLASAHACTECSGPVPWWRTRRIFISLSGGRQLPGSLSAGSAARVHRVGQSGATIAPRRCWTSTFSPSRQAASGGQPCRDVAAGWRE